MKVALLSLLGVLLVPLPKCRRPPAEVPAVVPERPRADPLLFSITPLRLAP